MMEVSVRRFTGCKWFIVLLLVFRFSPSCIAQNPITFVITNTPTYTPDQDTLYLVTSIDNWVVANPDKRFKLYPDGYYRLTIDVGNTKKFEFKINRGNWSKVEGNNWGDYLANRRFTYYDSIYEIKMRVASWQDLHAIEYPPVSIVVSSVPDNTPQDASIYATGTFNGWMDNDPAYELTKRADGTYIGEIQAGLDSFSYKFTRGSWTSIEGRWDGGMRSNRTYVANRSYNKQITAKIYSWNDLSSGMEWIKVIYLVLLLQSIMVLTLLIRYIRAGLLVILIALITVVFFAKFFNADFGLLNLFPYMHFIPVLLYPFIGSWMYIWFKASILKERVRINHIHFLPFLPLVFLIPYFAIPSHEFYLKIVNNEFTAFFLLVYAYGIALHLFFNYKLRLLISKQIADIPDLIYQCFRSLQTNWILAFLLYLLAIILLWQKVEVKLIIDWLDHLLWIGIGIVMIYYEWFFLSSLYTDFVKNNSKLGTDYSGDDSWSRLKSKLTDLMREKEIYTNPNLTLSDLAGYLGTNNHYVSKLINEGFRKSYTDYVNTYRVEAFIIAMEVGESNHTFLSLAYKVGFNSKSAFNRAFKKMTKSTPSEYFSDKK